MIFENRIVEEGFRKAFKDWGGDSHTKNIVQTLNRLSYFSFMCQMRKQIYMLDQMAQRLLHHVF